MRKLLAVVPVLAPLALAGAGRLPIEFRQESPPQFKAEVAAVLVDVLVLDRQGQPVTGLTKEDFEIYEEGVRQELANFDIIDWTSYLAREAPLDRRTTPSPSEGALNAFPRRFVFVLNRQEAKFGFLVRAKKALESFVVESMADGDEAMVIDLGMSTRVLQEFRDSKEETLRTIRKITPMEVSLRLGPSPSFFPGEDLQLEHATRNVYDTLESLGEALGHFPGRKIVIFMSTELSQTRNLLSYLQDTVNALNQSNSTVYCIDIRGVEAVSADQATALPAASADFDIGGLFPLANMTGGRYYYNLVTFEPAVRRIGEENRRYYLLTYTSTNPALDGKYRKIEVRVNRPDVQVVARPGYFARKPEPTQVAAAKGEKTKPGKTRKPAETPKPAKTPKPGTPPKAGPTAPPAGPQPPAQVEIATYLFPGSRGKVEVPIAVALPLDLLSSREDPAGLLTLTLAVQDQAGRTLETFSETVDSQNFFLVKGSALEPGNYVVRTTLDSSGKTIYQADTPIEVPGGLQKRFGLSSIAPVLPSPAPEGSPNRASIRIRPTSTLSRGEDAYLYFRLYPGAGNQLSADSTHLAFTILQRDKEIRSVQSSQPLRLLDEADAGHPVVLRVPTSDLPPGRYRIEVEVSDSRLRRKTTGEIELSIE